MIHIITRKTTVPGPDLIIDCPGCHAKETLASSAHVISKEYLYGLIPLSTTERTTIRCELCKDTFTSKHPVEELAKMTGPELNDMLEHYSIAHVTFITKFCILFSILAFYAPIISLILAVVGIFNTRKRRTRWRTAAFVGLILSAMVTVTFVLFLIFGPKNS